MPSPRHTDPGPAARACSGCRTTHRRGKPCPRPNFWLIAGTPVRGLVKRRLTVVREDNP